MREREEKNFTIQIRDELSLESIIDALRETNETKFPLSVSKAICARHFVCPLVTIYLRAQFCHFKFTDSLTNESNGSLPPTPADQSIG